MAIIHYDPFSELDKLQEQFKDFFNRSLSPWHNQPTLSTPVTDVYMDDDEQSLIVEAHLPGYNDEDIEVNMENGALAIRVEHQEKVEGKDKRKYIVRESSSSFYRPIGLPKNVDANNINAHFDEGVLKVTVPFKELPKPKSIKIEKAKKKDK